jgi:hypothetical protein
VRQHPARVRWNPGESGHDWRTTGARSEPSVGRGSGLSQARAGSLDSGREERVGRQLKRRVCLADRVPLRIESLVRYALKPMTLRHPATYLTTDNAEGIRCVVERAGDRIVFPEAETDPEP